MASGQIVRKVVEFIEKYFEEEINRDEFEKVYRDARMQLCNEVINAMTEVFFETLSDGETIPDCFLRYKKCQLSNTVTVFDMAENLPNQSLVISDEEPLRFWRDLAQQMEKRYSVCAVVEKEIYVFLLEKREEQIADSDNWLLYQEYSRNLVVKAARPGASFEDYIHCAMYHTIDKIISVDPDVMKELYPLSQHAVMQAAQENNEGDNDVKFADSELLGCFVDLVACDGANALLKVQKTSKDKNIVALCPQNLLTFAKDE